MVNHKTGCGGCGKQNCNHCKKSARSQSTVPSSVITTSENIFEINGGQGPFDLQVHFVGPGDPAQSNGPAATLVLPQSVPTGSVVTIVAVGSNVNIDPNGTTLNGSSLVPQGKAVVFFFTTNQEDHCEPGTWTDPDEGEKGCPKHEPFGPCNPQPVGCGAIKSPYFVQVCNECKPKKTCQPITKEDGINIQVHDVGTCVQGTIVLLPGNTANDTQYTHQMTAFAALGFRVIAIDQRGFGDSDQPYTPYNYNVWADDLRQVLDCLDVKNVTLLGHSLGSGAALHYAARHCGYRLRNLILYATPSLNPATMFPSPAGQAGFTAFILASAQADYPPVLSSLLSASFAPFAPSPSQAEVSLNQVYKTRLWAFREGTQYISVTSPLTSELANDMPNVTVPTLILHGTLDMITPFPIALALNAGIPGSTLIPFVGQGHLPNITDFVAFNAAVVAFAAGGSCS